MISSLLKAPRKKSFGAAQRVHRHRRHAQSTHTVCSPSLAGVPSAVDDWRSPDGAGVSSAHVKATANSSTHMHIGSDAMAPIRMRRGGRVRVDVSRLICGRTTCAPAGGGAQQQGGRARARGADGTTRGLRRPGGPKRGPLAAKRCYLATMAACCSASGLPRVRAFAAGGWTTVRDHNRGVRCCGAGAACARCRAAAFVRCARWTAL